jgi:hypothetical protein
VRGSFLFLVGLVAMALSPWYTLAFVLLLIGGLGTAAFSNMRLLQWLEAAVRFHQDQAARHCTGAEMAAQFLHPTRACAQRRGGREPRQH